MAVRAVLLALTAGVLLHGRGMAADSGRLVVDDLGQRVIITKVVKKVVSLVPSNSEMVCLLDCERLKAGTRYDRFPPELVRLVEEKKITVLGGGFDLSLEKIIEIDPDLILANGRSQERTVLPLKRLGYPVLSFDPRDPGGVKRNFLLLGEILGEEAKARDIVRDLEARLDFMQKKTRLTKRKTVYLQTWSEPMMTVGKDSFADALLWLAGGVNIFSDMTFNAGKVSVEWIIERNPEALIFLSGQEAFAAQALGRPEWSLIDGVKNRHVCFIEAAAINPRIRFVEGVEKLHRCLFPSGP